MWLWNWIGPCVDSAEKSGARSPIRSDMTVLRFSGVQGMSEVRLCSRDVADRKGAHAFQPSMSERVPPWLTLPWPALLPASAATLGSAVAQADIVAFALPWKAVKELMPSIGDFTGKIIVDPMNSVKLVDGYPLPGDVTTSVGEELQSLAPTAKVVKAFSTPAARNIVEPQRVGGLMSIPLAGADVSAKARVAALVSDLGLEPVDTGPLIASRYLEAMMRFVVRLSRLSERQGIVRVLPGAGGALDRKRSGLRKPLRLSRSRVPALHRRAMAGADLHRPWRGGELLLLG